jgi:hypothetical protein
MDLAIDSVWTEGHIVLNDDTQLDGLVQHNEATGIIYFKTDREAEDRKSFRENRIATLIYEDPKTSMTRRMYSFAYRVEGENEDKFALFEVLMEFKDFAILARKSPINVIQSKHNSYDVGNGGKTAATATILSQSETIFIASESGDLKAYLVISDLTRDGLINDYSQTNGKILDKKLIQKYVGDSAWTELQVYSKQNKLKFNVKEDLLKILEHYKSRISEANEN